MKATIYHNPRCSKSREALALLHAAGADITVVEYLRHPPARDDLARLLAKAGLAPRDALRRDAPAVATDDDALDLMARDPATIERPLVETDRGACLARPADKLKAIL